MALRRGPESPLHCGSTAWRLPRRLPRDPARQRPPLLPILLDARARHVEDGQPVARRVNIDLRVAQVRHERKSVALQEFLELARAACPAVDPHPDETDVDGLFLDRLV